MADDNPFGGQREADDNPFQSTGQIQVQQTPPPLPMKPAPDIMAVAAPSRPTKDPLTVRTAQLDDRERTLDARERALAAREQQVTTTASQLAADQAALSAVQAELGSCGKPKKPKNWPFFKPLIRQDIQADVTTGFKLVVTLFYFHWYYTLAILLYNLICTIAALVATVHAIGDVILAAIYLPIWGLLTWLIFRVFYRAACKNKPLHWILFFIVLAVQFLVCCVALIGWEKSGFMGIEYTIVLAKDSHTAQAFMGLANCILWAASLAFVVYAGIHARIAFGRAGGFAGAKTQAFGIATRTAADHPDMVAKAASTAASAAASNYS